MIVEGRYTTQPVHQAYIEPHACLVLGRRRRPGARSTARARASSWCAPTAPSCWAARSPTSAPSPAEIGGGFGGKTLIYLEPLALAAVAEVGPAGEDGDDARGRVPRLRPDLGRRHRGQDRRQEGRHDRRRARGAEIPGRRLPRLADRAGLHVRLRHVRPAERRGRSATTWCRNRPKVAAYRAPGAPIASFAVESALDELARQARHRSAGPARDERRARTARRPITASPIATSASSPRWKRRSNHPHCKAPLQPGQGRGIASGFWFNIGGESSARGACQRGRQRQRRVRQSRHRRLARLDGDDGRRGAGPAGRARAPDRRRHRLDRLLLPHRRQPRDLRHRHGGDPGGREGGGPAEAARRA